MRIAIVTNTYPPRLGGLENHIEHLSYNLVEQGHQVWVLTIAPTRESRNDDGVEVLTGRSHLPIAEVISFPSLGATRHIAAFLRTHDVELVSTHTRFFPMSLVGLRAAIKAGIPAIHTEHGSGFVASGSPVIMVGSRVVDVTMGRYVLRHATKVLAVSPQAAAFAARLGGVEAQVFYNAITPPLPDVVRVDRPGHLVFVGRVVPGKGWDSFLAAVAALRDRGLDVDGELLGDGAQLPAARRMATSLGLDGVVDIRGRVDPEEVRVSLAGSTLVNPTVLAEGFQTTLLETIAEQGRVVTFDVPGAQLLRESGAPVFVCAERSTESLVESLGRMLADPLPVAGEEILAPWLWPVRAREYVDIAQQVLDAYRR